MKNQGDQTVHFAQHLKRHRSRLGMGLAFDIYVERKSRLNPTLDLIAFRRLCDVSIVLKDGYDDEQRIRFTEREDIKALRDALTEALAAIENDATDREARA